MELKEKVQLVARLVDGEKKPGNEMVSAVYALGDGSMVNGNKVLFDFGQVLGAAKLAAAGAAVFAVVKGADFLVRKIGKKADLKKYENSVEELPGQNEMSGIQDRESVFLKAEQEAGFDATDAEVLQVK